MNMAEHIEKNVKLYLKPAMQNDPQAQKSLHVWLCLALNHLRETGEITDFVFNEIHNQHMAIANGETAAEATRTEKPQNAPRQAVRDGGIYEMVKFVLDARKNKKPQEATDLAREKCAKMLSKNYNYTYISPNAKQAEVFDMVAKIYQDKDGALSGATVRRIYFNEKKEREQ